MASIIKFITYLLRDKKRFCDSVISKYLFFLPDKIYLSLRYRCQMGHWINWKNPRTFSEKIQWLKLHNRKPEYTLMVDKYAVKKYVEEKIGKEFVIPTLGIWDKFDDIDFDSLPNSFVLKTTHGGGGGGVVLCRDKVTFDTASAKIRLEKSLRSDIYRNFREWPYKNVPRRIIAEEMLELEPSKSDLTDYKIYCFNGKPQYIQVIQDRNTKETIDFFDTEWKHQEFIGLNHNVTHATKEIPCPPRLDEMLNAARMLSKGINFVRVDLYNTDNGIYFGELTFFPASGIGAFSPEEWNNKMGNLLTLPSDSKELIGGGKYLVYTQLNKIVALDGIYDYKFFCFDGEPRFLKVDFDRFNNHRANYYDMDWHLLPFGEKNFEPDYDREILPPPNFKQMVGYVRKLSKGIPFIRVDLYNIAGKIYFGELTFYPASGMEQFTSPDWDLKIGRLMTLPDGWYSTRDCELPTQ